MPKVKALKVPQQPGLRVPLCVPRSIHWFRCAKKGVAQ